MKDGKWIALHKELKYFLPSGREYTILEAMFSYTLDADDGKEGTISGYSKLWGWSRTKVRKFIGELKTGKGHLTNRQRTGKRHQVLLKLNNLQDRKDTSRTDKEQVKDTQVDTTINPNPNPNPKKEIYALLFEEFWKHAPARNGKKIDKPKAKEKFLKLKEQELPLIVQAVKNYADSQMVKDGVGIKDPHRFISNRDNPEYWKEWIEPEKTQNGQSIEEWAEERKNG